MKKILVAGGSGLTGQSIREMAPLFSNFEFYFHNRLLGDLTNKSIVRNLLQQESPDLVILNAATLSGSQGLIGQKRVNSVNNFAIHRNFAELISDDQKVCCFSSYHVFGDQAPFSELNISALNETTEYALEKSHEILSSWENSNIFFILFPHLFGKYDNYKNKRAHFISNSIRRIKYAKENKDSEIQFFGDNKRVLQFASGLQSANFILKLCSGNNLKIEKIVNANIGWVIEIGKVFDEICQLIGFEGNVKYDRSETKDKDLYFADNKVCSNLPDEFRNELLVAIDYFESKVGGHND